MKWFRRGKPASEDREWERIQAEVRAANQWRFDQTATQRDLVDAVSQLLFRADPVGINFDTNTDEYDADEQTLGELAVREALAHEALVQWFDAQTAGPADRYAAVAAEIWNLWRRQQGHLGLSGQ